MPQPPDEEVFAAFPSLPITRDNIEIYRQRLAYRLVIMRCRRCRRFHEPARAFCPACLSADVAPEEVSGRGRVALATRVYTGPAAPGIDYGQGHPIVVVGLEEQKGLRLAGQFVTDQAIEARLDEPVELTWVARDGGPVPAFAPRRES